MYIAKLKKIDGLSDYRTHQFIASMVDGEYCYKDLGDEVLLLAQDKMAVECNQLHFTVGQKFMFECRASINDRRYKGVVYKAKDYYDEHIKNWFRRRLGDSATVDYVCYEKKAPHKIYKTTGELMIFNQTMFFGTLTVKDPVLFADILAKGIGRGKSFGFGAVILPQVMQ